MTKFRGAPAWRTGSSADERTKPRRGIMFQEPRALLTTRALLTITCIEFFGPIGRDTNWTHLLNPTWPGHARIHLVWFLALIFFSGLANLYLIWFRRPRDLRDLWLSDYWQAA